MAGVLFGLNLPFSDDKESEYITRAKDYALMNGLTIRPHSDATSLKDVATHVSLTLLPTPIPAAVFHNLRQIQTTYLEMYHKVAHDFDFLEKHLKPIAQVDEFVGGLWNIHEHVKERPPDEHRCLCLARNDFMLDTSGSDLAPKQIEINTIAASFGGLVSRLKGFHGHVLRVVGCGNVSDKIPDTRVDETYADAILEAVRIYDSESAVVMIVVEEMNRNIFDQRYLEHAIYRKNEKVQVIFRTLRDIDTRATLCGDQTLYIDDHEVALVYYRTAYVPDNFPGEVGWRARLLLEKSRAFQCPCIHTHLVGCKKIQQVLCSPGIVEKYVNDDKMAARIRQTFAHQYPTDQTPDGDAAVKLALEKPEKFVLKTQREGGGNNIYGPAIADELMRLSTNEERGKYVLMERIFPPEYDNYILFPEGRAKFGKTISEIGLYVSSVCNGGVIKSNYCGHLYRTKMSGMDEGGIIVGIGAIDSLILV